MPEHGLDVVGVPLHRVEESPVSSGVAVSDGRLHEMPGTVKLVTVSEVRPPALRRHHSVVNVEVAIRLLRCDHQVDHTLDERLEIGIRIGGEAVAGGLDPLRHIRVPEHVGDRLAAFPPVELEGIDAAGFLALSVDGGETSLAVGAEPGPPELIGDADLFERQRPVAAGGAILAHAALLNRG
jgi:hypothetical protein